MSTLYARKTSRGYAVWVSYNDRHGVRHRTPSGHLLPTLRFKAGKRPIWPHYIQDWKQAFDQQLVLGNWNMQKQLAGRISLSMALEQFVTEDGADKAPKTKKGYLFAMNKLISGLGDVDMHTLTEEALFRWRSEMILRDGEQNTALYIRSISPIFNWALRKKYITENPLTRQVKLKQPDSEIVIFSESQLDQFFEWIREHDTPGILQLFRFLLLSGWRVGDAITLTWDMVNFERRVIFQSIQKSDTPREYPMDEDLETFMAALPRTDKWVFGYRSISTPDHKLRNALDKHLKFPNAAKLNVHTFRKQFTYNCQRKGVPVEICSKLLGHRDIKTTLRYYTYWDTEKLREGLRTSRGARPVTQMSHDTEKRLD